MKEEMNSYDRVMTAFELKEPDRVPVTPFVREWCFRQVGIPFSEVMTNVEKYVYSQLYSIKKFGYDAVYGLSAVNAESEAMGSVLGIPFDGPPYLKVPAVQDYSTDLLKLKIPRPHKDGRLPIILEGIKRIKEAVENDIPVVGYLQGCLRHACMLRGTDKAFLDTKKNPDELKELLEIAAESLIIYGSAIVESGVDIVQVSDPTSSGDLISRKMFEEFSFPYLKREIKALKRMGVKVFLHICGKTTDRLDLMADSGPDAISIEEKVDLAAAKKLVGNKVCIIGNISPVNVLLSGTPDQVIAESKTAIEKAAKGGGYILASGCGVPADTPSENIAAMVYASKTFGKYSG
jgi:uroporphyrinogen decarboxylase